MIIHLPAVGVSSASGVDRRLVEVGRVRVLLFWGGILIRCVETLHLRAVIRWYDISARILVNMVG